MAKIIAISNQKGGVGKTTTAINLSYCLADKKKKVLAVDSDPQGNLTSGIGIDKENIKTTIYDLYQGEKNAKECIVNTKYKNLDIIPSCVDLYAIDVELSSVKKKEEILKQELKKIEKEYDYIIIDCPPALNVLTINAFTYANSVIIPIQCEYYALEGLTQLIDTINRIKASLNKEIKVEGILFTMYDSRTKLSNDVVDTVCNNIDEKVFGTMIPRSVRLAEAPSFGEPICIYSGLSTGARAYKNLAREILKGDRHGK